jgi:predicted transcriptional regulator
MPHVNRVKWLATHAKNRAKVMRLRAKGKTMDAIAVEVGVSRQRVSQIIAGEAKRAAK